MALTSHGPDLSDDRPTEPPGGSGARPPAPTLRLWWAVLCGYLAFGATLQALPTQVPARFGGGEVATGWAVGIAFVATALCRPWAGRAGDAGRSRPVALSGGVLIAVGGLGHLLAPALWVLLVARVVMGMGEAALFSASLPWVIEGTPADRRGRIVGWFGLSMWGGLAIGPVLAAATTALLGAAAVWWTVLALGAAAAGLLASTGPSNQPRDVPMLPRHRHELFPPGAPLPGLGFGLAATGYGTITTLLVLYLTAGGRGGQDAGLAVFGVAFVLARAVGSPRVDRHGGAPTALVALVVEAAGLGLIALSPHPALALPGAALAGVGVSVMFPATVAMTLARTGSMRPGVSVGTITGFWDLGILAAGPVSGVVATRAGAPTAFALAAAACLLAVGTTAVQSGSTSRPRGSRQPRTTSSGPGRPGRDRTPRRGSRS